MKRRSRERSTYSGVGCHPSILLLSELAHRLDAALGFERYREELRFALAALGDGKRDGVAERLLGGGERRLAQAAELGGEGAHLVHQHVVRNDAIDETNAQRFLRAH